MNSTCILFLFFACFLPKGEESDSSSSAVEDSGGTEPYEDTATADTVPVTLDAYTDDAGCWMVVTMDLEAEYWADYSDNRTHSCGDMGWIGVDDTGRCVLLTFFCDGENPQDDPAMDENAARAAECADLATTAPRCP
ncbi:MAG: hypothetical protein Q8P18_24530 [Pseudomonadota bacterium]|nr:hypothetical protein [Pseudomonadota bacterium]